MSVITVETDRAAIRAQVETGIEQALPILSEQVLKDCNNYCKEDQGTLISSSQSASDVQKGNLVWDTPYAAKQYYLPAASHDVNPNAASMWCHKAYDAHHDDWSETLQKTLGGDGS